MAPETKPSYGGPLGSGRRARGAALDTAILRVMKRGGRFPTTTDYARLRREIGDAVALYRSRGLIGRPEAFLTPPPPLTVPTVRRGWMPGLPAFEHLIFDSLYTPDPDDPAGERWQGLAENRTAHAWVLRHHEAPERPWLFCLHGLGTGVTWMDLPAFKAARLHSELGLNLVFPVLPLHGPRRCPGMPRDALLSYEMVQTIHGLAQAVWDVRRLIGWARAQGATRVGLHGVSVGAVITALVGGTEQVDLALAGIPLCDVPSLFAGHAPRKTRRMAREQGVADAAIRELYTLVSPMQLPPKAPAETLGIYAGRGDRITTPHQAHLLWEAWGRPPIAWFDGGHVSSFWSRQVQGFIQQRLAATGFAGPSTLTPRGA